MMKHIMSDMRGIASDTVHKDVCVPPHRAEGMVVMEQRDKKRPRNESFRHDLLTLTSIVRGMAV
jgi:hypothetical protein